MFFFVEFYGLIFIIFKPIKLHLNNVVDFHYLSVCTLKSSEFILTNIILMDAGKYFYIMVNPRFFNVTISSFFNFFTPQINLYLGLELAT